MVADIAAEVTDIEAEVTNGRATPTQPDAHLALADMAAEGDSRRDPVNRDLRALVDPSRDGLVGGLDEREHDLVAGHQDRDDVLDRACPRRSSPRAARSRLESTVRAMGSSTPGQYRSTRNVWLGRRVGDVAVHRG